MVKSIQNSHLNSADKLAHLRKKHRAAIEKVAESFESQFVQHMLKEMRKSIGSQDESAASDFYNTVMDTERSEAMSKQGLGIKEMIIEQLDPRWAQERSQERSRAARLNRENAIQLFQKNDDNEIKKAGFFGKVSLKEISHEN